MYLRLMLRLRICGVKTSLPPYVLSVRCVIERTVLTLAVASANVAKRAMNDADVRTCSYRVHCYLRLSTTLLPGSFYHS